MGKAKYRHSRIVVDFVAQEEQRYDTVGDYWVGPDNTLHFRITDFPDNPSYSRAILLHELIEKWLKDLDGVSDMDVDAWDMGPGEDLRDPGLDPRAPYHRHHMIADSYERRFICDAGEDWVKYESSIDGLFPNKE